MRVLLDNRTLIWLVQPVRTGEDTIRITNDRERSKGHLDMSTQVLERHIEITPGVAGGKPRIAGHRITVQDIVIWHESMGRSADEICAEYDLTLADVYAALAYYFDHQEEIDRSLEASEAFVAELRERTPLVSRTGVESDPR